MPLHVALVAGPMYDHLYDVFGYHGIEVEWGNTPIIRCSTVRPRACWPPVSESICRRRIRSRRLPSRRGCARSTSWSTMRPSPHLHRTPSNCAGSTASRIACHASSTCESRGPAPIESATFPTPGTNSKTAPSASVSPGGSPDCSGRSSSWSWPTAGSCSTPARDRASTARSPSPQSRRWASWQLAPPSSWSTGTTTTSTGHCSMVELDAAAAWPGGSGGGRPRVRRGLTVSHGAQQRRLGQRHVKYFQV
jgi:hypothetical protein